MAPISICTDRKTAPQLPLKKEYQPILPTIIKVHLQVTAPLMDLVVSCSVSEYPKQVQQEQRHGKATLHSKNHSDAARTEALKPKLTSGRLNAM